MENNNENNIGCTILFIIAAIATIIYTICNISSDTLAELGLEVMFVVAIGIVYFIVKQLSNKFNLSNTSDNGSEKNENKGCLKGLFVVIGILVLFALIFNTIGTHYEFNKGIGIIVVIIVGIVVFYYLWLKINDK